MTSSSLFSTLFPLALLACGAGAARAFDVTLTATETEQVGRTPAVITAGIPFARGVLADPAKLSASFAGKPLPAQFVRTVSWEDGSVRWALMDTQLPVAAGGQAVLTVSDSAAAALPPSPVRVENGADAVKVSTGPLQFTVDRKKPGLFSSIRVDGQELVTGAGRGLVVVRDAAGAETQAAAPATLTLEQAGPMRATVCAKGVFPGIHKELASYTVRITAYAGRKHLKLQVWLENNGAMGYFRKTRDDDASPNAEWFAFEGMQVELGLGLGPAITARCEDMETDGVLRVLQLCRQNRTQEKSRRGPFYTWNDFEYTLTGADGELKKGDRTDGVVTLKGAAGSLTAAVRGFWQNYEKAIACDGTFLRLWLWPVEGSWPRPFSGLRSNALYCRTMTSLPVDGLYLLPGGAHKGHTFLLDFSGRDAKETAAESAAPLMALAPAAYYAATEAAPGLFAPPDVRVGDRDSRSKQGSWLRMTLSAADPQSSNSLWRARETSWYAGVGYAEDSSHWFGWMDYGDLTLPGKGPVSLQHDWTWIMLSNALRTGNPAFLRLGGDMAAHRIEIDQFWSDRDLPECRGVERPGWSSPSYHCSRMYNVPGPYAELKGAALHYMLTGEPKALECCRRSGAGLQAAWAWVAENKPYGGPQSDMHAVVSGIEAYCALYAVTAERSWLDAALALFNDYVVPTWERLGPFLHDGANQIQSQDYVKADMKYCYSIAPLCEFHHLTGNETLFKLLQQGCEKPFPDSFFDAPFFLSDLYAYVGLKGASPELLEKGADLFAQGFPESKCPPVFLPDNSIWSRTSAMMLRTGNLLQYAGWKSGAAK